MYQFFIPNLGIILPVYYRCYKLAWRFCIKRKNLYRFSHLNDLPVPPDSVDKSSQLLVGEASPILDKFASWERHLRCRLRIHSEYFYLVTFYAICIEVQFYYKRGSYGKMSQCKNGPKLSLIIFVMCDNPLLDKLWEVFCPSNENLVRSDTTIHPKLGMKSPNFQLVTTKLKKM